MYVSMSGLQAEVDRFDARVAAFGHRVGLAESHEGFVCRQVRRSDRDPGEMLMISWWRDRDAFREYLQSSDHRMSHEVVAE